MTVIQHQPAASGAGVVTVPTSAVSGAAAVERNDEDILSPTVADQVAVGSPAILESPHVSVGPGRIANAPVPSVFVDDRGEIHRLRVGGKRLNLLFSKKEVMRSGYLHPNNTHDFVVQGKVEVWYLTETGTEKKQYSSMEYFRIESYVPHILYFLEDTVLLEWNDGSFQCWYYHPYRHIIEVQNLLVSKTIGQMLRLVPQDKPENNSTESSGTQYVWMTMGIGFVSGVMVGAMLVLHHRRH